MAPFVGNKIKIQILSEIKPPLIFFLLQVLGNFITFAAAIFVIIEADTIDPSQVGLIITYALSVTQVLNWLVRMTADVETNIVAVERIKVKYLISLIFDKYLS